MKWSRRWQKFDVVRASPREEANEEVNSYNYHIYLFLWKNYSPRGEVFEKLLYLFPILKRYLYLSINEEVKSHNCHIYLLLMKNHSPRGRYLRRYYILYFLMHLYFYFIFKKMIYLPIYLFFFGMCYFLKRYISLFEKINV